MKIINKPAKRGWLKHLFVIPLAMVVSYASAQVLPPPPPPPPSPGKVFNSINPFKSSKKRKSAKRRSGTKNRSKFRLPAPPAGGPPPPPDPLHLTKKLPAPPRPPVQ